MDDIAQKDLLHLVGGNATLRDSGADNVCAEVDGRDIFEATAEFSNGASYCGGDDDTSL